MCVYFYMNPIHSCGFHAHSRRQQKELNRIYIFVQKRGGDITLQSPGRRSLSFKAPHHYTIRLCLSRSGVRGKAGLEGEREKEKKRAREKEGPAPEWDP